MLRAVCVRACVSARVRACVRDGGAFTFACSFVRASLGPDAARAGVSMYFRFLKYLAVLFAIMIVRARACVSECICVCVCFLAVCACVFLHVCVCWATLSVRVLPARVRPCM